MINLLPDDIKRDVQAARTNVILLRYTFITIGSVGLLAALCLVFFVILGTYQSNAVLKTTDNSSKAQSFNDVRKQADEYRNNLTLANKVLGNSVDYTSVVFAITSLLPKGVVLDSLTFNAENFGQQTSLSARARSYDAATSLKDSFQKSALFSNVHLQSLTDASTQEQNSYPISVTISVKINKVNT